MANVVPFMRPSGAGPLPAGLAATAGPGATPPIPPPGLNAGAAPPMSAFSGPVANVKPVVRYDYVGEDPRDQGQFDRAESEAEKSVDLAAFRRQYMDFTTIKYDEMNEQRDALSFYDGMQWTSEELRKLYDRGQPEITFNRVDRKIDSLVGTIQRLRGDPKCFGRVQADEAGAEVATQCIRYCLDASQFVAAEAEALLKGMCMGYVVAELVMVPSDKNEPDIEIAAVDQTTFYYDPRSLKLDFSDCRYMGISKLFTRDEFEEFWPEQWEEAVGSLEGLGYTVFDTDKSYLWSQGRTKIRVVEHWYRSKGDWRFCYYAGDILLQSGKSPFFDHKGKTVSRFCAFAVKIDAAGDHYGYVRALKGPQRALNQHRSKAVHIMNTRQLIMRRGALGGDEEADIEKIRTEVARPDGVVVWDGPAENKPEFSSQDQEFLKQSQYYADAKQEIESFGPSPQAILGAGLNPSDMSNRTVAMQAQMGMSEMGQFITQWRNWRQKLYRLIWSQQQRYWTAEQVLRVTNDQGLAQYVTINAVRVDQWNRPILVNALGQIDVDIIADEGPDTVNVLGDVYDILTVMAQQRIPIPPEVLIECSPLPQSKKKELIGMIQQKDPIQQAAAQTMLQNKQADTQKKQADTQKSEADAMQARAGAIHRLALSHHEVAKAQNTSHDTAISAMQAARGHDSDVMDQLLRAAAGGGNVPGPGAPGPTGLPAGGTPAPAPASPDGAGAALSPLGLPPGERGGPPPGGPMPGPPGGV
jgi:hypothetical protein